jgi:hypothetical protein
MPFRREDREVYDRAGEETGGRFDAHEAACADHGQVERRTQAELADIHAADFGVAQWYFSASQ